MVPRDFISFIGSAQFADTVRGIGAVLGPLGGIAGAVVADRNRRKAEKARQSVSNSQAQIDSNSEQVAYLIRSMDALRAELDEEKQRNNQLQNGMGVLERQLIKAVSDLEKTTAELASANVKIAALSDELTTTLGALDNVKAQLSATLAINEDLTAQLAKHKGLKKSVSLGDTDDGPIEG